MRTRALASWLSLVGVLGAAGAPESIAGQDSHYWAEQYGTRATLLGGAMIGSVSDLSAVYYNPGALALIGDQGFILSARANRFGKLTIEDGAGPGRDLASSTSGPLPTMLAGAIRFDWLGKSHLAYSVLSRNQFNASLATTLIEQRDVLVAPGDEDVASAFTANATLSETWAGLAWGYPLSDQVGIGLTQFFATRQQSFESTLLAQAATTAGDVSIGTRLRRRSFTHYRALWKFGLGIDLGAVTMGFNVTSPSVSLGGSGASTYNSSIAGLDIDGDGTDDPLLASDIQADVSATFKSPLSIGLGAAYGFGDSRLHVSAEWFAAQSQFTALDTDAFTAQTPAEQVENDLTGEFATVLNWGVGIEHTLSERASLYASYSLDRSAVASDAESDLVLTEYDIDRFGGGASFVLRDTEIMLGVIWSGGSDTFPRLVDFDNLDVREEILAGTEEVGLRFSQWTVVFGFELGT